MKDEIVQEKSASVPLGATFPPIGDYGIIGDGRTAALVSRSGDLDWLCLPHFSGTAVFAALLDRRIGGAFSVRPRDLVNVRRSYVGETAVLETVFETSTGTAVLTDAMTMFENGEDDLVPESEILRRLRTIDGTVTFDIRYEPRPGFGAQAARIRDCMGLGWWFDDGGRHALLRADFDLDIAQDGAVASACLTLQQGETRFLSMAFVDCDAGIILPLGADAETRLDGTIRWWRAWSDVCRYRGPYRDAVVRSAITLKLLTFSLSGAVIAATTAGLPETIGGERNWDYRYCWLRDASLTLEAFLDLGYQAEGAAFMEWLLHSTRLTRPKLQVLYDVFGEARVTERELTHLSGYKGSRPVRIGNGAWDQLQIDAYGEVAIAAAAYAMRGGTLDFSERRLLRDIGRAVCRLWREKDSGIWEVRDHPRHYTHSKVMAWAALDCLLYLDGQGAVRVPRALFERERAAIGRYIEENCLDRDAGYLGAPGLDMPDAALLLMPRYRYLDGADPRMARTVETIKKRLGRGDALVLRYPSGFDGLPGEEHPFGICSFWMVEALARQGRHNEARRRFERLLCLGNDLGLYAEEVETGTGAAIGNFPQAFTHVGLIIAAVALNDGEPPEDDDASHNH